MKKSQILAALALAFALGVVAPVAGLANNASAYNEEAGTATYGDVDNAIDYVERSSGYKAYVALEDADEDYKVGLANTTIAEIAATSNVANVATDIKDAIDAAQAANGLFGYNTTNVANKLNAETIYTDQINVMVAAANSSELYKAYVAIENLIDDESATDAQLVKAVTNFRVLAGPQGLGFLTGSNYDNLHPEKAKLAVYRSNNPIAAFGGYTEAVTLRDAVKDAEEALAKYNKGYKLFIPLLNNSSIVTKDAKDVIAKTQNITLATLDAIATNSCATTCVAHYSDWQDLETELNDVKNGRRIDESGDNYDLIFGLAEAWQKASGNEEKTSVVAARMAAYKAPVDAGDNTDSDASTTLKPGNTGLVGSAEGTATTVSIVAGLATALTALGAGVVVYRNARREK